MVFLANVEVNIFIAICSIRYVSSLWVLYKNTRLLSGEFFIRMPIYILLLLSRSSPNYASVNTSRGPLCGVWPTQARRGFEGVYFAGGRPTRRGERRGREMEEEGDLDDWCQIANNKVQGWIFCGLIPCKFPNMRVQKIWQN